MNKQVNISIPETRIRLVEVPSSCRDGTTNWLLSEPVGRVVAKLAWPTTAVLFIQLGVVVLEMLYAANLSSDDLAAASLVMPFFLLMVSVSNGGIGSGVASWAARAAGAGRVRDFNQTFMAAVILAVVFGSISTIAAYAFGDILYRQMEANAAALPAADGLTATLYFAAIPVWVTNLLAAALRGAGNARVPSIAMGGGLVLLAAISPCIVFGVGPLPGLGLRGIGVSFSLYYTGVAIVLASWTVRNWSESLWYPPNLRLAVFVEMARVSIPAAASIILLNAALILRGIAFDTIGPFAVAGYVTAVRIEYFFMPMLFGLASAVLTTVGAAVGAGDMARARAAARDGAWFGAAVTGVIGLVASAFPTAVLDHLGADPAAYSAGATYLQTVGPLYGTLGFGFVYTFACLGAGQTFSPLVIAAIHAIAAGLTVAGAIVCYPLGPASISAAAAVSLAVSGAIAIVSLYSRANSFRFIPPKNC